MGDRPEPGPDSDVEQLVERDSGSNAGERAAPEHGLSTQGFVDALNRAAETGKFADI
jgi:hypothetical protein